MDLMKSGSANTHYRKKLKFRMSLLHVCIHGYKLEIKVEDKNNAKFIFWDDQCVKFMEKSVASQIQLMKDVCTFNFSF